MTLSSYIDCMTDYVWLVAGWAVYFAGHSLLASPAIKRRFHPTRYRIVYSLIATAGLLVLLFYNGSIRCSHFFSNEGAIRYASLTLTGFGVIVIQLAFRQYDLAAFLGFREERSDELKSGGILGSIRHPIYAGLILITLGFFLFTPNLPTLVSCSCILLYLPVGMWLEERKLIAQFGQAYLEYKKKVPALIPRVRW